MSPTVQKRDLDAFVDRLLGATNAHDLDKIADCFASDYRNDTPAHPERSFVGREQVRRNWSQILGAIPDLTTHVPRRAYDGASVWTEWEQAGTRPDGTHFAMSGIVIFGVDDGRAAWARFFLEPVVTASSDIDHAVGEQLHTRSIR